MASCWENRPIMYCLFRWGAATPGKRPSTALFKVYKSHVDGQSYRAARVDVKTGKELTKNLTTLSRSAMVRCWSEFPQPWEVREAKQSLRALAAEYVYEAPSDSSTIDG